MARTAAGSRAARFVDSSAAVIALSLMMSSGSL
jgi:hypothetical protein